MKGNVVFRSENKIPWNELTEESGLFDGDRVSTGRDSAVTVKFKDGREVLLGEDSQVVISSIAHSESGPTYIVNLIKGSVTADAKGPCKNCRNIVLKSAGQSFEVGAGKQKGLYRDLVANKVESFSGLEPPVARDKVSDPPPVEEKIVVEEKPVKIEKISPKGYEYTVKPPVEGLSIWTHKSLATLFGVGLSIPVAASVNAPPFPKYVPIIEVSNLEGSRREVLAGLLRTNNVISLPMAKLRFIASQKWSGVKQYTVNLRGGIRVQEGGKNTDSFSGRKLTVTINTLDEPIGIPITMAFDRLSQQTPPGNWIPAKVLVPVPTGPIQVTVAGANDFSKLIPFAVGATRYGAMPSAMVTSAVANVVRDGFIVAQIGKYTSTQDVKAVLQVLRGDFAFIGSRNLFQYSAGNSQDGVIKLADDLLDKGRVLYFFKNDKLYPVNRTFVKNSKEVANFLGQQANVFFTEKVEIVNK